MAGPEEKDELHPEEIDNLFKDLDSILAQNPGAEALAVGSQETETVAGLADENLRADMPAADRGAAPAAGIESAGAAADSDELNDSLWQEMTLVPAESAAVLAEEIPPAADESTVTDPADDLPGLAELIAGLEPAAPPAAAPAAEVPPPPDGLPTLADLIAQSHELVRTEAIAPELAMPTPPSEAPTPAGLAAEKEMLMPVRPLLRPGAAPESVTDRGETGLPDFSFADFDAPVEAPAVQAAAAVAATMPVVAAAAAPVAAPAMPEAAAMPGDITDPAEWFDCGNAWRARGAFGRAAECYERALEIEPNFSKACCNLAGVLFELGERGEAVKRLRAGLKLDPGNSVIKENLAGLQRVERRKRSW